MDPRGGAPPKFNTIIMTAQIECVALLQDVNVLLESIDLTLIISFTGLVI